MVCFGETPAALQRDINRRAAVVDSLRHSLLDGPGERTPGESVQQYLTGFVKLRAKETSAAYRKRVKYYVTAALNTSTVLKGLAIPAPGAHDEPYSTAAWKEIVKLQQFLPRSAKRLGSAFNLTAHTGRPLSPAPLITLINLELAAYQALRDARPNLG